MRTVASFMCGLILLASLFQCCPIPVSESPPDVYGSPREYTSTDLEFSVAYPEDWVVKMTENPEAVTGELSSTTVVEFFPPTGHALELVTVSVSVMSSDDAGGPVGSDDDYVQTAILWMDYYDMKPLTEPMIVELDDCYRAVEVSYSYPPNGLFADFIGFGTLLSAPGHWYLVEACGPQDQEAEIHDIYRYFMSTFDVLSPAEELVCP